jgi:hypothetical protein
MICNSILSGIRERDRIMMMFWEGRKAIFSCDQCEKCGSTEISQIRFRGVDNPEMTMSNAFIPISGKILMRCNKHRIDSYSMETETIYHPNPVEIESRWERRTIQGPPIQEVVVSHDPQRDKIIFDENDFIWEKIR